MHNSIRQRDSCKIFIWGYTQSIYIMDYIQHILDNQIFEIYLLDNGQASREYYNFYSSRGVTLLKVPLETRFLGKIPKVRGLWYIYRIKKTLRFHAPFDVIQLHFVNESKFKHIMPFINDDTRLVASFWGSDIYRKTNQELYSLKRYLEKCAAITLSGERMHQTFIEQFGSSFNDIIYPVFFGISTFDVIDQVRQTMSPVACKLSLGLNPNSTVVSIGYNRVEAQQHDKVLQAIMELDRTYLNELTFLFPFTYGECSDQYRNKLKDLLELLPCEHKFIEGFQSAEQIAIMRLATDVYINAQTTDAFSASVQEYLYAGSTLLNPSWIKYKELNQWGVRYLEYADFQELGSLLASFMEHGCLRDFGSNGRVLKQKTSWSAVRQGWLNAIIPE